MIIIQSCLGDFFLTGIRYDVTLSIENCATNYLGDRQHYDTSLVMSRLRCADDDFIINFVGCITFHCDVRYN